MNSPHLPSHASAWFWKLTNPFCTHSLEHRPELSKQEGPKHQFLECPCWRPGAQERGRVPFLCYLQDKHLPGGFCGCVTDTHWEGAPGWDTCIEQLTSSPCLTQVMPINPLKGPSSVAPHLWDTPSPSPS